MSRPPAFPNGRDSHARCGTCGQAQHVYLFPFADPAASKYTSPPRVVNARSLAAYEKRVIADNLARLAAQAKGRNYSKCLLCSSSEGSQA